ncbi:Sporulation protein RMD1 [Carex littledalei]|uniref:Sporulation protein RMD1 n=1 Tax=Carex littledalei TaxID=544730 RepID=A0A833QJY5_9POAL|nr:Sporulation protein RMD1 [Carex littledalei]
MRRLRALLNQSLLIRSPQKASSSSTMVPPFQFSPLHNYLTRSVISSFLRGFSTLPASSEPYEVGFVSGHRANRYRSIDEEEEVVRYVPVKAYFLSTSIDLKSLQVENACDVIPPSSRSLNYIALRYSDFPPEITDIGIKENRDHKYSYRYVIVFQYGSAVLFNIADHEAEQYLDIVRKHASGLLPEMRKDDYAVVEKRSLPNWMQGGPDYIILKSLDIDGIRIIGSVLGQSIALDHYIRQVDDMVEEFTDINRVMEKTGNFDMKRKKLFQLVGKANSNLADVIIRLGLFDRSEIAWKNANYAQILEYLREEYELNQRFGSLDFKLKFVEHNIHFLQEVLQNRRSDLLEWGVIILLTIEIVISMYEIVKDAYIPS